LTGHARHGAAADQCVALEAFEHLRLPAQPQKDQHRLYVADAPEDLAGTAIRRTSISSCAYCGVFWVGQSVSILTTSTIFSRFLTPGEETDSSKAATHEDRIVKIAIVGASVRAGSPIAAELAPAAARASLFGGHRAGAANGG
jgi:hypothetical protein